MEKLKTICLDDTCLETEDGGGGSGLDHLFDATADGSLRGNTATAESSSYKVGKNSIAIGEAATASGENSSAFGYGASASGKCSHASGGSQYDSPDYSVKANGNYSHAEGCGSEANGEASHAEGWETTAKGSYSHAEGQHSQTGAGAYCAHAEGSSTEANGVYSHSEGVSTVAGGRASHAEGIGSNASGRAGHAEGEGASANGDLSHSSGYYTKAEHRCQFALGRWNDPGTSTQSYVFIIGKGLDEAARSNALTVDWNGNTKISGTLTQSSDKRLKDHRGYLGSKAIEFVRKLKPAFFYKDKEPHVGLYAQDVEDIDPYRTILGEMNGFKTINYTELIPHLITYCQHLEQRIEELERR